MVGVAVISHGSFCEGIVDSLSMIAGVPEQLEVLSLKPGMSPDYYRDELKAVVEKLDTGAGVVVVCDILGGTPFNSIAMLSQDLNVQILTGMNLPALISLALERTEESTMEELIAQAETAAHDGIKVLKRN